MTHKVGAKGQVVIPKDIRETVGLHPGDEVAFSVEGPAVRLEPMRDWRSLRGRFAGLPLTKDLEKERRRERRR
ncbi:MAG: AbrB/MazE/SpoVT family DNA-binding domain-containing protein [Actinomycetota bacterium]